MDDFEIIKNIGGGGGGIVHLIKLSTGELRVLKVMFDNYHDDIKKAIEAEKRMLEYTNIESAYLVKYFKTFENPEDGSSNIIMEYCPGGNLLEYISKNYKEKTVIPLSIVLKIIAECIVGLFVLHRAHIMHRDIKPENIFLMADYNIKIGDFGAGKKVESTIAKVDTIIGTEKYKAPELALEVGYTLQADLFSLGATFYQLVELVPVLYQIKPVTRADVPEELRDIIAAMTSSDPADRGDLRDYVTEPVVKNMILALPHNTLPKELLALYDAEAS